MDNIASLTPDQIISLRAATEWAIEHKCSLRIATGENAYGHFVMWDMGNTGWTHPHYSE